MSGLSAGAGAYRVTLPAVPPDLVACFRAPFPEIPDRDLTRLDVTRIIAAADALDEAKTACGARAATWMLEVRRDFAR